MNINPILASGARRRMRSWKAPLIVTLYGLTLLIFAFSYLNRLNGDTLIVNDMRAGTECYIFLIVIQFFLTILVAPAMTAGSISGERERQTLDLLLVTNTGSLRITFGKLLESFGFIALLIFSSMPMLCIVLMTGGITIGQIATSMLFMLLCAFAAQSVGLFASALCKRTVAATVLAYLILLAIGVGTLALAGYSAVNAALDYDTALSFTSAEIMGQVPWILYCNPGVGLLALGAEQTLILRSTLQSLLGYSMSYYVVERLDFNQLVWGNMLFMFVGGLVFSFAASLLVRPRKHRLRKVKKA